MAMHATTVRFADDLWAMLEDEARRHGVSAAQFVREATLLRLGMLAGTRQDDAAQLTLAQLAAQLESRKRRANRSDNPVHDQQRLKAVEKTRLLDSESEARFDRLAELAANVLAAPVALVSLVHRDRQFFKSCIGLPEPWATQRQTPMSHSFCQHAIAEGRPLVINNAHEDPRVRDNLAIRDLNVVAYLGVPLVVDGQALGTLCVIDDKPRVWLREQIDVVKALAAAVTNEIRLTVAAQGL